MLYTLNIKTDDRVAVVAKLLSDSPGWRMVRELESVNYGEGFVLEYSGVEVVVYDQDRTDGVLIGTRSKEPEGYRRYGEVFAEIVARKAGSNVLYVEIVRHESDDSRKLRAGTAARDALELSGYRVQFETSEPPIDSHDTREQVVFRDWIQESRDEIRKFGMRWTLVGRRKRPASNVLRREGIAPEFIAGYSHLIERGQVYWAAIAIANPNLRQPGTIDCPANVLYGTNDYFDARPAHLMEISRRVTKLRGTFPTNLVLKKVAEVISDDLNYVMNWRLPYVLTDGHTVFLTSVMLHRGWLPAGVLATPVIPILAAPDSMKACMAAPLTCWPSAMRRAGSSFPDTRVGDQSFDRIIMSQRQLDEDARDAAENPHRALRSTDLVPDADKRVLSLTPGCAARVRTMAQGSGLRGPWMLKVGGDGNVHSLDIVPAQTIDGYSTIVSEGIRIDYPMKLASNLHGTVIDFRHTSMGAGFQFIEC